MSQKLKRVYQQFEKTLAKKEDIIFGDLGIYLGGKQLVVVPNRPSFVYVRLRSSRSEVVQAFNDKVAQKWDLPVELVYKKGKYIVVGKNENLFSDWVNDDPYVAKHAETHIFNQEGGQVGGDIVWTYPQQFIPHLVHPFNSPGATNVFIHSHPLLNEDGWIMAGNTGTVGFTPYRPTNGASLVLVTLEKSTGNPNLFSTTGTFIPENITGSNSLISYYPIPTSDYIPLAVVRLVSGTTTINWENIYDVRQFNAHLPFISVNSFTEIDNLQFTGLTVTSTGTVAYLQATGGSGGTTGSFGNWLFDVEGMIETGTSMSQPYLVTENSAISKAYLYAEHLGVTGTTIVDVLKNGSSIFTGTPLSLPYNLTGSWVSLSPFITNFVRGDIIKINILQKAKEAKNLKISLSNGIGLGASGLTVEEQDGSPSISSVEKIKFPNGVVTNEGGGTVSIAQPTYGSKYLGKRVATNSTSLDFTSLITSDYDIYEFEIINIVPATDAKRLWMRMSTDNGVTFVTGSVYTHSQFRQRAGASANSGAEVGGEVAQIDLMGDDMPNSGSRALNGTIILYHPLGTTYYKDILGETKFFNGTNNIQSRIQGQYGATGDVDAVRFLMSSGLIASGEIHMFARTKT